MSVQQNGSPASDNVHDCRRTCTRAVRNGGRKGSESGWMDGGAAAAAAGCTDRAEDG